MELEQTQTVACPHILLPICLMTARTVPFQTHTVKPTPQTLLKAMFSCSETHEGLGSRIREFGA